VVLTNHAQKVQILQDKKTNADYAWRTAYNRIVFARGNNLRTEDVLMLDLINDRLKTLNKIQEAINNLWSVAR
jgi:ketosteroid isomerase-like protein